MDRSSPRTRILVLGTFTVVSACGGDNLVGLENPRQAPPLSVASLSQVTADTGVRDWNALSTAELWRYLVASDSLAAVGLRAPGQEHGVINGRPMLSEAQWEDGRRAVFAVAGVRAIKADTLLPWVRVKLSDTTALRVLRSLPFVEYVEPALVVDPRWQDSGCSQDAWPHGYSLTSLGDALPYTFHTMQIDRAWEYSQGAGVWIGLVDTGVDRLQPEFGAQFSSGASQPREIWRTSTTGTDGQTSPQCTHGTRVAGVIAAPMNGTSVVGVAWKANLASAHHSSQLGNVSATDAQQAIRDVGEHGARVVELAFQSVNWLNAVEDEINYWWWWRDVVFVGAAGTYTASCYFQSSNNVMFPAEMDAVIAVSAAGWDGSKPCTAGYGPELDLIAIHNQPTTGVGASSGLVSVGQSSNASAVVAGVAALVRSREPHLINEQVQSRLVDTGGRRCSSQNSWHILVNALAAVGGPCVYRGDIAPYDAATINITFDAGTPDTVRTDVSIWATGGSAPLEITWSNGQTGPNARYTYARGTYQSTIQVNVRDPGINGSVLNFRKVVHAYDACSDPEIPWYMSGCPAPPPE